MTNKNDDSISRAYYKLGKQIVEELQSALIYGTKDKEKKHPHWIPKHSQWSKTWECSNCGYRVNLEDGGIYHYCSSCGRKKGEMMDKEWIDAEQEAVPTYYYWVTTPSGRYVKCYKPGIARIIRERTGWDIRKIYVRRERHDKNRSNRFVGTRTTRDDRKDRRGPADWLERYEDHKNAGRRYAGG